MHNLIYERMLSEDDKDIPKDRKYIQNQFGKDSW